MPRVSLIVRNMPRLSLPRFTRPEMKSIGEAVKDAEIARIKSATKPDGSQAAPLSRRYAISKTRRTGRNKRDWTLSGGMLDSLRATASSPTKAIIKFSAEQQQKAIIRERKDEMFDLSNRGEKAGANIASLHWDKAVRRANKGR